MAGMNRRQALKAIVAVPIAVASGAVVARDVIQPIVIESTPSFDVLGLAIGDIVTTDTGSVAIVTSATTAVLV